MSHFSALVIVPADEASDEEAIRGCVAKLMEPYDEAHVIDWDGHHLGLESLPEDTQLQRRVVPVGPQLRRGVDGRRVGHLHGCFS